LLYAQLCLQEVCLKHFTLFGLSLFRTISLGKKGKHHYEDGDEVPFEVNKIGPYSNPTGTQTKFAVRSFAFQQLYILLSKTHPK
jgi:hypothetical protein